MKSESNYDKSKQNALKRFLTFDQNTIIQRLQLQSDDDYIYIEYYSEIYRLDRRNPHMERSEKDEACWKEADFNEVLTICDFLCHTETPMHASDTFASLQSLNVVQAGNTQSTLGDGLLKNTERLFDGKDMLLGEACERLGGIPVGKGDVAYEIPMFKQLHIRFSFYNSDDEFDAKITIMFPTNICNYLYYETLYYTTKNLLDRIKKLIATNEKE